jgi:hypothetical protein
MTLVRWRRVRLVHVVLFVLFALLVALATPPHVGAAVVYPNSMASTGDSITRAFNTGFLPFTDAATNSWSTGTNSTVNSIYNRLRSANPSITGRNYNYARTSAPMSELSGQFDSVMVQKVEYVTVLMGANDVCADNESQMTSVDTFRSQFQAAMTKLAAGSPTTRVYVVSIPDVYNLWDLFHNNSSARQTWFSLQLCQSMLANPASTRQADVDRRARVRQRNIDFNTVLAQVCAQYPNQQCRFDGNAVFNNRVAKSDVSTRDYFHPSLAGQAKLAAVAWGASGFA